MKNFIIVCLLATSSMAESEIETPGAGTSPGLGVVGGWTSGIGFAYRQHFDNFWGIQVGGGAIGTPSWVASSVGVQVLRTFSLDEPIRFYGFVGSSANYVGSKNGTWDHLLLTVFGAGIGAELRFTQHVACSLEIPLAVTTSYDGKSFDFVSVLPIPSASMVYYF